MVNENLMRFARAAQKAGFLPEERRRIAENPVEGLKEKAGQPVQERLTPEMISTFLSKIESIKGSGLPLVQLGTVLADMSDVKLNPADCRLANLMVQYIEESFYDGSLLGLSGFDAAAMTYVINRLAKLKRDNMGINGFDQNRLEKFIDDVSAYEEQYYLDIHAFKPHEVTDFRKLQQKFDAGYMTTAQQDKFTRLKAKEAAWIESDGLDQIRAHRVFSASRDWLAAKLRNDSAADLYMVKSFLVAKDQQVKDAAAMSGKTVFTPAENWSEKRIDEHNFLPDRTIDPDKPPFFIVHVNTDDLPFEQFAVRYLNTQRSIVIQTRKEKEKKKMKEV